MSPNIYVDTKYSVRIMTRYLDGKQAWMFGIKCVDIPSPQVGRRKKYFEPNKGFKKLFIFPISEKFSLKLG